MFTSWTKISICLVTAMLLTACSSNLVNPQLKVSSTVKLNSQGNKHAAPVQMQIYYLRDYKDFKKAGFFDLYDLPRRTLGTDYIKKTDKIIVPGSTVDIQLSLNDEVKYLGLLTAFTQLRPEEDWRFVIPIEQLSNIKQIVLDNNQMIVELIDPEKPIILETAEAVEAPEGESFSLDDLKKQGEDLQKTKDNLSADKLKEQYSGLDPRNKAQASK